MYRGMHFLNVTENNIFDRESVLRNFSRKVANDYLITNFLSHENFSET